VRLPAEVVQQEEKLEKQQEHQEAQSEESQCPPTPDRLFTTTSVVIPEEGGKEQVEVAEQQQQQQPQVKGSQFPKKSPIDSLYQELCHSLDRWLLCPCIGGKVLHTPIVPCKSPLEGPLKAGATKHGLLKGARSANDFGRRELLRLCQERGTHVGLVVDLEGTQRWYPGFQGFEEGVEYVKAKTEEGKVPDPKLLQTVLGAIDSFRRRCAPDRQCVALHCSDGVNRTGYFTVAYLLLRTEEGAQLSAQEAVRAFEVARGCRMDSRKLLDSLSALAAQRFSDGAAQDLDV
ncbi:unnamed protein product, partial [Polarella glacialis]